MYSIHRTKNKKSHRKDRIFYVEPRGIEPPDPSVNHEPPHQRWPLGLHASTVTQLHGEKIKKVFGNDKNRNPRREVSDSQGFNWRPAVDRVSIANHRMMSSIFAEKENRQQ